MQEKIKVLAYVVQNDQLLVVEHVDFPECGQQIPGGTVEKDESLEEAVIREVTEETGLRQLDIKAFLGQQDYCKSEEVLHKRYFYLITAKDKTANSWYHNEIYPSEGQEELIRFRLVWQSLNATYELADSHDHYLSKVKQLFHQ
jgi:ADP-ribose pyrophosphatase YjhB (NUDIX family)